MIIQVLVDNTAEEGFDAVHGFSLVVDFGEKILFDLGPDDTFLKNARRMKIDLDAVKTIVLSHGHWDHGDGLANLSGKNLVLHSGSFIQRFRKRNNTHVGLSMQRDELKECYNLVETDEPYKLGEGVFFLGEIPRINDFEAKTSPFLLEDGESDFVLDDSAIAIKSEKGLVVISGCAHAGICNTIAYAKKVCGEEKVHAVLGGFHLKELDELTMKTIAYLKNEEVEFVGPTHCTSFNVRDEFSKYFNILKLNAGAEIEL